MARVVLGVTGGIAAYKACELCRLLVKAGHEVVPLVTRGAERFISQELFDALARRPPSSGSAYPHLEPADLLVVAPLTANSLGKLAHGLTDNVLTDAALAHEGPVLVAPAMNVRMWAHPATQANVSILRERGVELIGPEEGDLAEGDRGIGRMAEPVRIFERIEALLEPRNSALQGKKVLVTAGGTREPLDSVRYVGNRSSGRMGVALADEARRRGADVTLLASNLAVPPPEGIAVVEAQTAEDVLREASARTDSDLVLMAAAVADYRAGERAEGKRTKSGAPWTVELVPTVDVLEALGQARRNGQVLVGFAADEGEEGLGRARAKLERKKADLIVFNDVSRDDIGFDAPDNEVVLISQKGELRLAKASKREIAAAILDEAEKLLGRTG
jgi:phosphopantothenoylcysteine decarboxylase / phosphopantothenate---cysteine ligase